MRERGSKIADEELREHPNNRSAITPFHGFSAESGAKAITTETSAPGVRRDDDIGDVGALILADCIAVSEERLTPSMHRMDLGGRFSD